jgi:glycosyltransferase involved in cell wall biosynthesis
MVSNAGGLPESVVDGKTGYVVDPDNIDEMVSKLLNLLENENLRVCMGKAGKEYYENTFSYKRWIQEMKTLNKNL